MKFIFPLVVLCVFRITCVCSQTFDSSSILYTAKLAALSHFSIIPNNMGFHRRLSVTSAKFHSQTGLKDVLFIKVKIRFRKSLEEYVFYQQLTKKEHSEFILLDDVQGAGIIRKTLFEKYGITDTTNNDILESYLPENSSFYDTTYNKANVDYFYAYLVGGDRLIYLGNSRNINNDSSEFWRAFYNQDIMSWELKREISDKNVPVSDWKKLIKIEGFKILN